MVTMQRNASKNAVSTEKKLNSGMDQRGNQLREEFSRQFLHGMSDRIQSDFGPKQLERFLNNKFEFFLEAMGKQGLLRLERGKGPGDQDYQTRYNGTATIEIVSPIAPYGVVTLEKLMRERNLHVTRSLHPMMSVSFDREEKLISISAPDPEKQIYDYIYIQFESDGSPEKLKELETAISRHMLAVQCSFKDQSSILDKLEEIKNRLSEQQNLSEEDVIEWQQLCDWLKKDNFSFFGYCSFSRKKSVSDQAFELQKSSGLGILSDTYLDQDGNQMSEVLKAHLWRNQQSTFPFKLDRVAITSPLLRFENLMRLGLQLPSGSSPESDPEQVEHVFLGLLRSSSLNVKNTETPLIHRKMKSIFQNKRMLPNSYDYNEVVRIFGATPKFEMFRSTPDELLQMVEDMFSVHDPNRIHCFRIKTKAPGMLKLMIMLPLPLFNETSIRKVIRFLEERFNHSSLEWYTASEGEKCRLHLEIQTDHETSGMLDQRVDLPELEKELSDLINPWDYSLKEWLRNHYPGSDGKLLFERYSPLMPEHYKARVSCEEAAEDIRFLEKLSHGESIQVDLKPFQTPTVISGAVSLLLLYTREQLDLNRVMPALQNLGVHVIDQLSTRFGDHETTLGYIQSFRVTRKDGSAIDESRYKPLIEEILREEFLERTRNDPLNALALLADLNLGAIKILQLYRNLYLQLDDPYSRDTVNQCLLRNPGCAKSLYQIFLTRFSPAQNFGPLEYRQKVLLPEKENQFKDLLNEVKDISEDVILRRLYDLIQNTLRTNFFRKHEISETFISIKLDSRKVEKMPIPTPLFEIFVQDVGMEGTHLRFGNVARGGLRWSDRPDDFRTEILGLAKTQQSKNVVIVPVGSKGGFVLKTEIKDRKTLREESHLQYQRFIRGMLEITDNLDPNGNPSHPRDVICYDSMDPYMVVAADKGTATFSDTANQISKEYGYWLGDAFASGGSSGYDHKEEAITSRGAWECIKLHFLEMGHEIESEITRVVGIGDMSGDVFGNGMLLSKTLQLNAAFNHLHIFLDPDPDPELSWKERHRLFQMSNSSWKDYNSSIISRGGGVFERRAKAIDLSPETREMLGTDEKSLTGEEVIQLILKMKVDLILFGGVGTFVKSPAQNNLQVGDQANNSIRIDSSELGARVVGEGANLGLTQLARIDFNHRGGRLNTDAIDNSAGVNMSDYEVNLKILLEKMQKLKKITSESERNHLLEEATDEVSELVLANNRAQHRLISKDVLRSKKRFRHFRSLIQHLSEKGLNKRSEYIPSRSELDQYEQSKQPIPRPVLAVLQAYAKMEVYEALTAPGVEINPSQDEEYLAYLPEKLKTKFGEEVHQHPLKKEIISTVITNRIVNQAGSCFFARMQHLSGKGIPQISQAYRIMETCINAKVLRQRIDELPGFSLEDRYLAQIDLEESIFNLVRTILEENADISEGLVVSQFQSILAELENTKITQNPPATDLEGVPENSKQEASLETEISIRDSEKPKIKSESLIPADLKQSLHLLPDVLHLVQNFDLPVVLARNLVIQIEENFGFKWILAQMDSMNIQTNMELEHQDMLTRNLGLRKKKLLQLSTPFFLENNKFELRNCFSKLGNEFETGLNNYQKLLDEIQGGPTVNLNNLTVLLSRLDFLEKIKTPANQGNAD